MARPYIKGGTPTGSASLCRTCSHAQIMTGYRESEQITLCNYPGPSLVVPFVLYDCSNYYDKNRPSWKQMEELAITVSPGPPKSISGFRSGPGFAEPPVRIRVGPPDDDEDDD